MPRNGVAAAAGAGKTRGWYHGWNIVAAAILAQVAANGLTYNAFPPFLSAWARHVHVPVSELQLTVAGMVLVAAIASPAVGALADRAPARRIFMAGLLGMGGFFAGVRFSGAAPQILGPFFVGAPP